MNQEEINKFVQEHNKIAPEDRWAHEMRLRMRLVDAVYLVAIILVMTVVFHACTK